jgi:hypothetical protein
MPNHLFVRSRVSKKIQLRWTIALIASIWIVSDTGYYFALPALGYKPDYNGGPIAIFLYYIFWTGFAVITFWPVYAIWPRYAKWDTFENRFASIAIWSLAFLGAILFVAYVVPTLPRFDWPKDWGPPPELPLATTWYFLPKSVEILFQQLLVVALVLTLAAEKYSLLRISLYSAALFGAAHLLLAFGEVPWGYVARFAIVASVFGFVFPYLILRVPNGFAYSYVVHWGYYAFSVFMSRVLGPVAVLNFFKNIFGGP